MIRRIISTQDLLLSGTFYVGLGLAALWYVRKIKHPRRKLWVAWLQFVGIVVGSLVGALFVAVFIAMSTGFERNAFGSAVGPILAIGVLIPAWGYAKAVIRRLPGRQTSPTDA